MRWIAKAALQRTLSVMPAGEAANYFLQRHVTRGFPRSDEDFRAHAEEALAHFRALHRHAPETEVDRARAYEFGAGWDLVGPIMLYRLGINRQTLVDIRPNLRLEQVNHSLRQYAEQRSWLEELAGRPVRELEPPVVESQADLEARLGVAYLAPRDARATDLPSDSFELISSTFTLEHIPSRDIEAILVECQRLLAPGGVLSCAIDMKDHYAMFDRSISHYNFLKFSDRTWRLANSSLHYQNRLRQPDYRRLVEETGLEIVEEAGSPPDEADRAELREIRVAPRFRHYTIDELGGKTVTVVALKR